MSKLELHRQEFEDLLTDVRDLEVALHASDSLKQTHQEIDLIHARFENLREQLSLSQGSLPNGVLVVESDLEAFWILSRDWEGSNIRVWEVSDAARIEQIHFVDITERQIAALPLLSQLKDLLINGIGKIDCTPLGDLLALNNLGLSGGLDTGLVFLERLTNLTHLHLEAFALKSVEPIPRSESLRTLSLTNNPIEDLSAIDKFPNLSFLGLDGGLRAVDLAPLIKLSMLERVLVRTGEPQNTISLEVLLDLPRLQSISLSPEIANCSDNEVIIDKLKERKVEIDIF